jgi:hypothetical protein
LSQSIWARSTAFSVRSCSASSTLMVATLTDSRATTQARPPWFHLI